MQVERLSPQSLKITEPISLGWERWCLLTADWHYDSLYCRREVLKKHLDLALERNAHIFIFGDMFDWMGGKYDPRRHNTEIRKEYSEDDYFGSTMRECSRFISEYKHLIRVVGRGNHDTEARRRHDFDFLGAFGAQNELHVMGYHGWIFFRFHAPSGTRRHTLKLYYHHGAGGNAPVTKGTLKPAKRAVYVPDADFVCTGHIHEEWIFPITRVRITNLGTVFKDYQYHVQLASYKGEESSDGGFLTEKETPPKPVGGVWLRFFYDKTAPKFVNSELIMALES